MAPPKKDPKRVRKTVEYVDNKKLSLLMTEYYHLYQAWDKQDQSKKPKIPDYAAISIMKIAERLATKPNFAHYSFKQDMIDDGILNCVQYIHNFNPNISQNAFSYFTQIIHFAFLRRIEKQKKETEGTKMYKAQLLTEAALMSPYESEEILSFVENTQND